MPTCRHLRYTISPQFRILVNQYKLMQCNNNNASSIFGYTLISVNYPCTKLTSYIACTSRSLTVPQVFVVIRVHSERSNVVYIMNEILV